MRPAEVAIALPPLGRLYQLGTVNLKVLLVYVEKVEVRWCQIRTIGTTGKNLPVPSVEEFHCGATSVWLDIIVQQQYPKLEKHLRGLRFQTDEDVQ
jgi:hypothetical protein